MTRCPRRTLQDEHLLQTGQQPLRDDELEALLVSEAPWLLGLARRLAPAEIDAADLVQDTAERAWAA